ncbi:PDR/VanB family oxidoreductase [Pusillimonas sp. SM2304]|uniref:PDR/VanB family oxidoreductase n=1 Tax=Pusillimonas sp. SM2304 TaxID=3073241 RepID=UPI00287406E0|nr:PDR/VanB family oxidoreductase [Pusillimonas sp. SM2304]MDS1139531.1 PDR/VanB family oxidoreductase [Pusillimonas sp. SM2304]
MAKLTLTVSDTRVETPMIRSITLTAADGGTLPPFAAGAHLKIRIPGQSEPRCYSLVCLDGDEAAFNTPSAYRLGVRLEDPSTGGSQFMHGLQAGDTLEVEGPKNDFPLHDIHANEQTVVLIAGGIGITPIASMAAALKRAGRPFILHYYGRSREQMGFLQTLAECHGDALHVHADDDAGTQLPLPDLLDQINQKQHVYVCGPKGLIDAVIEQSRNKSWPNAHLHFELFANAAPQFGDRAFEVELRQSGKVLQVPADKTILDVLEEAGCDPLYDCRRGECGVCQATVLEGTPDHRDYYLSDAERDAGDVIQICISRSHSDRLVLDL